MKKILTVLSIILVMASCAFALQKRPEMLPAYSQNSTQQNKVWVGTFQLVWNEFADNIVKGPVKFVSFDSDIAEALNKQEFKKSMLSENSYYTAYGKPSLKLKEHIEKAILEKDEKFSNPVYVYFKHTDDFNLLCAKASFYICKYANMIIFEDFNEAMFSSLMTLRENIFTDPQKPLKVESKIYEFNEPSENSLIFLTTNFALTFFAVANELENLKTSSYLIVIPADGMSVLTAWSAEKFTAKTVVQMLKKTNFSEKVKNRKIIIPGLLAHMKKELDAAIKSAGLDFEIVIGTIDACDIADFVKSRS